MSSDFLEQFGRAVRRLREERSLTQGELAKQIGLSRTSVTNLESGRQNPPLSLLPELSSALGVDVITLITCTAEEAVGTPTQLLTGQIRDGNLRRWVNEIISEPVSERPDDVSDDETEARR